MVKIFSSARKVFRYYFPEQFEEDRKRQLSFYGKMNYETNESVKRLLKDFKSGLKG